MSTPMAKVPMVQGAVAVTSAASWRSRDWISSRSALARRATLRKAAFVAWSGSERRCSSGRSPRQALMTLLGRPPDGSWARSGSGAVRIMDRSVLVAAVLALIAPTLATWRFLMASIGPSPSFGAAEASREDRPGSFLGVDGVGLAAVAPSSPVGSLHLEDHYALGHERSDESDTIRSGALDAGTLDEAEGPHPAEQGPITTNRCLELLCSERSTRDVSPLPRLLGEGRIVTMPRRRHTPEQIVRKLREADKLLNEGQDVAAVCRHLQVSEQTYHRWRNQYGGMKADDAKELRELRKENQRLKRIVADKELEIDALREISRETSEPVAATPGGPDAL